MRITRFISLFVSVALLSSCTLLQRDTGSNQSTPSETSSASATTSPSESSSPSTSPSPSTPVGITLGRATVSGKLGSAPVIKVDTSLPDTTTLLTKDIAVGTGKEIQSTSTVTVQYTGVGASTGTTFDSSWTSGQPATFPLNGVITGWQEGLIGAKVGGRRILVIPGPMAYGENPPANSGIQPNETLIFVVDVLNVQ